MKQSRSKIRVHRVVDGVAAGDYTVERVIQRARRRGYHGPVPAVWIEWGWREVTFPKYGMPWCVVAVNSSK